MSQTEERDAIKRNLERARDDVRRDIEKLDGRIGAMKKTAATKVPLIAAGATALGFVLAFAPRAIKKLFSKRERGPAKGSRAGARKPKRG